jgi:hypothetical protein
VCIDGDGPGAGLRSRRDFVREAAVVGMSLPLLLHGESVALAATREREIICKDAWGARPSSGRFRRHRVQRLTVHHSGRALWRNRQAPERIRDSQRYHQTQGWPDIAYHVLIDRHGNIYKGRPSWAEGDTFTDYDPRGHFLVMCEGNFSEQRIPDAQIHALRDVLAWARDRFEVAPRTIRGHRDYAATACPGTDLYRLIASDRLRGMVQRRLHNGGVELEKLCGESARRRVAAIERGED